MVRSRYRAAVVALVVVLGITGAASCGSGDDDEADTTAASEDAAADAAGGGPAPDELVGTYEVTLEKGDLPPDPAPELTDGSSTWILEIANTGEADGRTFGISNKSLGLLEEPDFSVDGDTIFLIDEECATEVGYEFYDNEYRYELQGDSLTFTTVDNSCPDQVAETILTSRPWTRAG